MWAWTSTRPGKSDTSPRSWTRCVAATSGGSSRWGTTARIRPLSVRTAWSGSQPDTVAFATRLALNTERSATIASQDARPAAAAAGARSATFGSDEGRQRLADLAGRGLAAEVARHGLAFGHQGLDGPHDGVRGLRVAEVLEQHGAGPDLGDRVGDPLPRDVRRRAVHGLEHRRVLLLRVDVAARRDPDRPRDGGAEVGEDVPEEVGRDHYVEPVRVLDEVGGEDVDVVLRRLHVGVALRHRGEALVPVRHAVDDAVRLGGRGHVPPRALHRALEGVAHHAIAAGAREHGGLDRHLFRRVAVEPAADLRVLA